MKYSNFIKPGIISVVFFALYWYVGSLMYDDPGFRIEYIIGTVIFGIIMFLIEMIAAKFRKNSEKNK